MAKIINRWRIGSLSMGIILLAFGILLLVSLIIKINAINIVYMLSPVVLICLGLEIMLHLFVRKDDNIKIKYDFLSIIFISIVLLIGAGVYFITGVIGFFETREDMFTAFGIRNETVHKEYAAEFENSVNEIALLGTFGSVRVLPTDSDKIKVEYYIRVDASDKIYAESVMDKTVIFSDGEQRVSMISDPVMMYNSHRLGWPTIICTVYMPKDKNIDLSGSSSHRENIIDSGVRVDTTER
ncbi:MAG: hypothetical protein FWH10_05345 [Oscillospiraceae bacterium]|nr:hypothetical protein [Oscillospiraceae bacterium]